MFLLPLHQHRHEKVEFFTPGIYKKQRENIEV